MFYAYLVAAAALIPLLNNFFEILGHGYSWWLVPLLYLAFFLGFIILHLGIFAISGLCVNLKGNPDRAGGYFRWIVNITIPLLFKIANVHIHTTGGDKIPEDTRVLAVCNHINDIDPVVIMHEFPQLELGFIAKKEVFTDMKFIAKFLHKLHGLPIDRENNREAVKTILTAVKYLKEDKASIGIFPEGYTSLTGELQEMRNGAFKIASKAEVPIVVFAISGTRNAFKRVFREKIVVNLDVVDIITADEVKSMHTDAIGERVYNDMARGIAARKQ